MSVLDAARPEEIFGRLTGGDKLAQLAELASNYRHHARNIHPDQRPNDERKQAEREFDHLTKLYKAGKEAIHNGTYGTARTSLTKTVVISTRKRAYTINEGFATGDVCNLYRATYENDDGAQNAIIKVARNQRNNDLVKNEAETIRAILSNTDTYDAAQAFLPRYLETFAYRVGKTPGRQAIGFQHLPNLVPLIQVRDDPRYHAGVHPKDMAWMMRRLLVAIGIAAKNGFVHGAVLPTHILIEPEQHGLVLVDWKYSVPQGKKIRAISAPYRKWYPPEVLEKKPAGPGTDVWLAMRVMTWIMGGDPTTGNLPATISKPVRAFIRGSTLATESKRPQDPWSLQAEFDELIEMLWGPKQFRPFEMSTVTTERR